MTVNQSWVINRKVNDEDNHRQIRHRSRTGGVAGRLYQASGQPDRTTNGALIGGASGAAIGALADRRAPGVGALIG
jgi:hypothetical protein